MTNTDPATTSALKTISRADAPALTRRAAALVISQELSPRAALVQARQDDASDDVVRAHDVLRLLGDAAPAHPRTVGLAHRVLALRLTDALKGLGKITVTPALVAGLLVAMTDAPTSHFEGADGAPVINVVYVERQISALIILRAGDATLQALCDEVNARIAKEWASA